MEDSEITGIIIGCAMRGHSTLGNGFQEVLYQRALGIELVKSKLQFSREYEMPVYCDSVLIGTRRVDFLVEERISVELKALVGLENVHLAQAKNNLEAYNLKTGLLINSGGLKLLYRRLFNNRFDYSKKISP